MTLLYFILLVGVLVLVHEAGHFAAARAAGVQVERFSLGLGPALLRRRVGRVEIQIGAIPLGGYVRLLGEEEPPERAPSSSSSPLAARPPASFAAQPLWRKAAILLAGPAMNLALPPLALFGAALADASGPPAVVGTVFDGRPADGHLQPGDVVLSVDGEPVHLFEELSRAVAERPGRALRLEVLRGEQRLRLTLRAAPTPVRDEAGRLREVGRLGIAPHLPLAVVGVHDPRSPAWQAGIRPFDRVVGVDGEPVDDWAQLLAALEARRGRAVSLALLRPEPLRAGPGLRLERFRARLVRLWIPPGETPLPRATGLQLAEGYVRDVAEGSAAWRAGIRPGDRIASVDGRPAASWDALRRRLSSLPAGAVVRLGWWHAGKLREATVALPGGRAPSPEALGLASWLPRRAAERVRHPHPLRYAWRRAWRESRELLELTAWAFAGLLRGVLPVETVGGPIAVYGAVEQAVEHGPPSYLRVMAFLSINLALLNLLPIPLLDGGQLGIALLEALRGRPLSRRSRALLSLVGLLILLAIMALVLANDLQRLAARLWEAGP